LSSGLLTRLSVNPHLPLEFSGKSPHTNEVFQSSMVKVMPNQKSVTVLPRSIVAAIGGAFLFLCAAATVRADDASADDDLFSTIFSTYGITVVLLLVLVGLFVFKKIRAKREAAEFEAAKSPKRTSRATANSSTPTVTSPREPVMTDERRARVEAVQQWENPQPASEASVYGAYRIDQEVGKLVLGKPHRMDVMASRATEDRRAIEGSLVKALDGVDATEESRGRVRRALEEYGFVAGQSATLLLGRDAWERSSAARILGQICSKASLPFLIEALHDGDSVVRNQVIASLGALKTPSAIGALLDIARRHPDIPASLLSETLSACSVESLGYLDSPSSEPAMISEGRNGDDLRDLQTFKSFEDLPAGQEDQALTEILTKLEDRDEQGRAQAVQQLGFHAAQRSVAALSSLALNDSDSSVRAAAVSSLGTIDHESVFAPVLIALADESREVRAAAARSLTSLHFDRADAYLRVMESTDTETMREVAQACIKTGIVAQTVDRLASEDRRQAYEAFSLFSLLARAGETQPILDAIRNHRDDEVRLCAVRVLSVAALPELAPKVRELVAAEDIPENVRTALLEVLYKLDQEQPIFDLAPDDNVPVSLHNS
jgi:HEAT repeat protein